MDRTHIEWTDATWNPLRGCEPVSAGCRNCYAARMAHRFSTRPEDPYYGLTEMRGGRAVFNGRITVVESALTLPLRWRRPRRIFVNSMSDLFHESVPDDVIANVFGVMHATPRHTYQILTKRPDRMAHWINGRTGSEIAVHALDLIGDHDKHFYRDVSRQVRGFPWPLPNVWIGTSVENQEAADVRLPHLCATRARVRFVSCEPLLGPVSLHNLTLIRWVIAGGESGPGARPMHPEWPRSLRDQCATTGVPFFFKQWGEWVEANLGNVDNALEDRLLAISGHDETYLPIDRHDQSTVHMVRVGKRLSGNILDGEVHQAFPEAAIS